MAGRNWIKDLVDEGIARRRGEEARRRALALIALGSANPTEAELQGFKPGVPIDPQRNVTGASAMPDFDAPEGVADPALAADLQQELRNEELQRAALQGAPDLAKFRRSLAFQDAGLNESTIAAARVHNIQADDQAQRNAVTGGVLTNPDADPLLKIDVANKRDVFQPKLVKVKRKDGSEVYMHQTPTLSGTPTFGPALDENGNALRVPLAAGGRPSALAQNAALLARTLYAGDPDAETKAVERLTSLKTMTPQTAWDSLRREAARIQGGKYARTPQKLYEKTVELWRLSRPMEEIPAEVPGLVTPPPLGGAAVPPRPGTTPKPAAAGTYRTTDEVKAAFGAGRLSQDQARAELRKLGM